MEVIELKNRLPPEWINYLDQYVRRSLQHGAQINERLLDPVHLAFLQSDRSSRLVRLHDPFDPLELCQLAARVKAWRFLPGHIAVEPRIARSCAGYPFVGKEPVWPRSDGFL